MEFKLLIIEADNGKEFGVINPEHISEENRKNMSSEVKEHTFTLKHPIVYGLEMDKNRLKQIISNSGIVIDDTKEKPATIVAYLEQWTLKKKVQDDGPQLVNEGEPRKINMDEINHLNPILVDIIYNLIAIHSTPQITDITRFFPSLKGNGKPSQVEESE